MAFQGNDHHGQFIRSNLKKMGVTTEFIKGYLIRMQLFIINLSLAHFVCPL
jgi:hypothetical protein